MQGLILNLVFRDLLEGDAFDLSRPRSIDFTDEHLERAIPLKDFLDCIHGEDLFVIIKEYRRAKDLIGLLYKYDCPAWLAILRTSVRLASARMTGTHDAHDLFKLSAALFDPIGCSEALPAAAELTWANDCDTNAAGDKVEDGPEYNGQKRVGRCRDVRGRTGRIALGLHWCARSELDKAGLRQQGRLACCCGGVLQGSDWVRHIFLLPVVLLGTRH